MKLIKRDGWWVVGGYDVYLESWRVKRANVDGVTLYPYCWSRKNSKWVMDTNLTFDVVRDGLYSGLVKFDKEGQ